MVDDKVQGVTLGGRDGVEEEVTGMRWSRKWRSGRRTGYPCGCWSPRRREGVGVKGKMGARCTSLRRMSCQSMGDTIRRLLKVEKY